METKITMPALSPTMKDGTLSRWLISEGDKVSSGDVIAEIETDKATMELEAVEDGVLAKILVAEGTVNVDVNAPLAVINTDDEIISEVSNQIESLDVDNVSKNLTAKSLTPVAFVSSDDEISNITNS